MIPTEGSRAAAIVASVGRGRAREGPTSAAGCSAKRSPSMMARALSVGRAVWTDARGDRVFSELRGEPVATGRRIVGTITGGTGRYAGVDRRLRADLAVRRSGRRTMSSRARGGPAGTVAEGARRDGDAPAGDEPSSCPP